MAKTSAKLVRLDAAENRQIEMEAERLGLSGAELLRRSVRVALPLIKSAQVPGATRLTTVKPE